MACCCVLHHTTSPCTHTHTASLSTYCDKILGVVDSCVNCFYSRPFAIILIIYYIYSLLSSLTVIRPFHRSLSVSISLSLSTRNIEIKTNSIEFCSTRENKRQSERDGDRRIRKEPFAEIIFNFKNFPQHSTIHTDKEQWKSEININVFHNS